MLSECNPAPVLQSEELSVPPPVASHSTTTTGSVNSNNQMDLRCPHNEMGFNTSKEEKAKFQRKCFTDRILSSDTCLHYTGIPTTQSLNQIFDALEPVASKIKYSDGNLKQNPFRTSGRKPSFIN